MWRIASTRIEAHIEGLEILIPPFVVGDFVRVVFVRKHGMVFEYMQYLNHTWFGD
jgi:hypothetical protein